MIPTQLTNSSNQNTDRKKSTFADKKTVSIQMN